VHFLPCRVHAAASNQLDTSALLRFGFPKGSLQKATEDLFKRAGFKVRHPGLTVMALFSPELIPGITLPRLCRWRSRSAATFLAAVREG
jgi:hypothetical protein